MSAGDYGTKAVPTYVAAEAETTPLPKITVPEIPRPDASGKGLGDLPMRVVYRAVAAVGAIVILGVGVSVVLIGTDNPVAGGVAAPAPSNQVASTAVSVPAAGLSPSPAAFPAVSPAASSAASTVASPSASSSASPTPFASPTTTAMSAALSDPRVPALPVTTKKLAKLSGKAAPVHRLIKDRRSGVAFPRFAKAWKLAKSAPFASRQVLPKVKGSAFRGLLVSCAVPIPVQPSLRDTAFLAGRWTLNHLPSGATITWSSSQPITVSKRDGWLLAYKAHYTLKGKKRTSMAAVALIDVPHRKPALVFMTIPDTQKSHWRDINVVMSRIKAL